MTDVKVLATQNSQLARRTRLNTYQKEEDIYGEATHIILGSITILSCKWKEFAFDLQVTATITNTQMTKETIYNLCDS